MSQFPILDNEYRLAETSFGDELIVFKATAILSGRTVRICTPNDSALEDPVYLQGFTEAAERLAAARTPYVVNADFIRPDSGDPRPYLVTDWLDNCLETRVVEAVFEPVDRVNLLIRLALLVEGLEVAGFIHGNLQPADIFSSTDDQESFRVGSLPALRTNLNIDSAAYSAPETAELGRSQHLVDQYGWGVIAYRLYLSPTAFTRAFERRRELVALPRLDELGAECGDKLAELIVRTVANDPTERFASASILVQQLRQLGQRACTESQGTSVPIRQPVVDVPLDAREPRPLPDIGSLDTVSVGIEGPGQSEIRPGKSRDTGVGRIGQVIVFAILLAGALYGWQHYQLRSAATRALEQTLLARAGARENKALEHAAQQWADAELEFQTAHESHERRVFESVVEHALEARRIYEYAEQVSLERRARLSALAVDELMSSLTDSNVMALEGYQSLRASIQSAKRELESASFTIAREQFEAIKPNIEALVLQGRSLSARDRLNEEQVALERIDMNPKGTRFAVAQQLGARAAEFYARGQWVEAEQFYIQAMQAYVERAAVLTDAQLKRLLEKVEAKQDVAAKLNALGSTHYENAERALQRARQHLSDEQWDAARAQLGVADEQFEAAGQRTRADSARETARRALRRLVDLDAGSAMEIEQGLALAGDKLSSGELPQAAALFHALERQANDAAIRVHRDRAEQLWSRVEVSRSKTLEAGGERSAYFNEAAAMMAQARNQMDSGDYGGAQFVLENALESFETSRLQIRSLTAREAAFQAQTSLRSAQYPLGDSERASAQQSLAEGDELLAQHEYQEAAAQFEAAQRLHLDLLTSAHRTRFAELEEQLTIVREQAREGASSSHFSHGVEMAGQARELASRNDYVRAFAGLAAATEQFEQAQAYGVAVSARSALTSILERALAAGADLEEHLLEQTRQRIAQGDVRTKALDYAGAKAAYEAAYGFANSALIAASKRGAEHVREMMQAVRQAATASGASETEPFLQALEVSEEADELYILGDFEQAVTLFVRAQNGFDRADKYWAAAQARDRAIAKRDIALRSGAQDVDVQMISTDEVFAQAEEFFGQALFARAADLFLQSLDGYDAALVLAAERKAANARAVAVDMRSKIFRPSESQAVVRGDLEFAAAQAQFAKSDWAGAVARFNEATVIFENAVVEGQALSAQIEADRLRETALKGGARVQDAPFNSAASMFDQAMAARSSSQYASAIELFAQAGAAFTAASSWVEGRTRLFMAGSTPDEISSAQSLCGRHVTNCNGGPYTLEVVNEIRLRPFVLDDHEVTNEEFAQFVHTRGYITVAEQRGYSMRNFGHGSARAPGYSWRAPGGRGTSHARFPNRPVVHVTQADAREYCVWAGGRLPSALEWEFVGRGESRRAFPWGDEWMPDNVRWAGDAAEGPMPIYSFPTGATPEGVHDLAGNVREWTSSTHEDGVILKGGSWVDKNPANFRAAASIVRSPDEANTDYGFRCAWDLDAWP